MRSLALSDAEVEPSNDFVNPVMHDEPTGDAVGSHDKILGIVGLMVVTSIVGISLFLALRYLL